jgi:uncharacterized membrane-anchored protein YitT (DUF2179 family)
MREADQPGMTGKAPRPSNPAQNGRGGAREVARDGRAPLKAFTPEEFLTRQADWLRRSRDALPRLARLYALMCLGSLIMAAGYSFFMIPQKIAPGGVYGIAMILHYASVGLLGITLPTGALGLALNIPLFFWALRELGTRFISRTIFGMVATSVFMDVTSYVIRTAGWQPSAEGLDPMLAAIFGGLAIGCGLGLIFRQMGSTGGSDIVGQILGRKTNISIGAWMIMTDALVVVLAAYYFKNINLSLYAVVTIFVCGRVIDALLEGPSHSRAVTIISERSEPIREAILFGLDKTGTLFEANGLYRGAHKNVFLCVVNRKQVALLERLVAKADPEAFLIVSKAHEVLGEGFKPLRERLSSSGGAL